MSDETPTTPDARLASLAIDWGATLAVHARWLRTVVAARLGERQGVDEVLQDVSLAAVADRSTIDPTRVAGWLYRLAVRKTLLHRRTLGRRRKLIDRLAARGGDREPATPDPMAWLLLDERRDLVRSAVAALPGRDDEILLLKYTEGWSCRDLAQHLGQSESAIEARLHRARGRLRAALATTLLKDD